MKRHTKIEALDVLLDEIMQVENDLLSDDVQDWLKKQSAPDKAVYSDKIFQISIYRSKLQNLIFAILLDEFNKTAPQLKEGVANLQREIQKIKNFTKAMATLGEVLGLVGRVVTLAAAPSLAPVALAVEKKVFAKRSHIKTESAKALPGISIEAELSPVPTEEVLYGVELTEKELILTVASGGCTTRDSFHVDVNKGFTGRPPYLVTVYRIVPDDCLMLLPPIQVSFSREELELNGTVEFVLLNKIGNTSNHRLSN